jgi:hypothetical protein
MTDSIYLDVVEMIQEGDFDDNLESLRIYVVERQQKIGDSQDWARATRVKVIGKLKPNYLFGHDFPVVKRNPKSIAVAVPDTCKWCLQKKSSHKYSQDDLECPGDDGSVYTPRFGRFAGSRSVRIPKNALEIVG